MIENKPDVEMLLVNGIPLNDITDRPYDLLPCNHCNNLYKLYRDNPDPVHYCSNKCLQQVIDRFKIFTQHHLDFFEEMILKIQEPVKNLKEENRKLTNSLNRYKKLYQKLKFQEDERCSRF